MQPNEKRILDGWKEIAAYLRVSVRTAQQWEAERGLPVERMSGARSRVSIEVGRLEQWRSRQTLTATPPPRRRLIWAVAAMAALVLAGLGLIGLGRRAELSHVSRQGGRLIAEAQGGSVLWTHEFENFHRDLDVEKFAQALVADLDGDGEREVIAANPSPPGVLEGNGLYCFSSSGKLKWRFQPGKTVKTPLERFDPPYHVRKAVPFRKSPGEPWRLAVISIHSVYFPSQVAVLDANGRLLREYWHAGHLHGLAAADLDNDGQPEIYASGVSNGHANAVVLALDPDQMEGAGWEDRPEYRFEGMEPGVEIRRWLTPRTPLSRKTIRYNVGSSLNLLKAGVEAVAGENPLVPQLVLCLRFGPRLSDPRWEFCDCYLSGLARMKAMGLAQTETMESEARGATGFTDVTSHLQETARRRTTERGATQ